MKFHTPDAMPARSTFSARFLEAVFPELGAADEPRSGYAYTKACARAAAELGIAYDEKGEGQGLAEDSELFRLLYELDQASQTIFRKSSPFIAQGAYHSYTANLAPFCSEDKTILDNWLKQSGEDKHINKSFDAALFFTYLLLRREPCRDTREGFFRYCLDCVGVTELEEPVAYRLFTWDWAALGQLGEIGGVSFPRLGDRAIVLLAATVLTILEMIGTYRPERDGKKVQKLHAMFREGLAGEEEAARLFDSAQQALLDSIRLFEPRSIRFRSLPLQELFVAPRFCREEGEASPLRDIGHAPKSRRILITAQTGMGKSAYLQMASLCMLHRRDARQGEPSGALAQIARQLDAPEDMRILSVPARMFSFCQRDERYRPWTEDLVTLFFNCMWRLSPSYNFYSAQSQQLSGEGGQTPERYVTPELLAYVRELARRGRLLLVLDSFDEISSGQMRRAYLNALQKFYITYCCDPEQGDVGAHVLLSSRDMSPDTMRTLAHALELDRKADTCYIRPLGPDQRRALVDNWCRVRGLTEQDAGDMLEEIQSNDYYLEYAANPYMLSVVCVYLGHDLWDTTQRFIGDQVDKLKSNNLRADEVIQAVLRELVKVLQKIAVETVVSGHATITRQQLNRHLARMLDELDVEDEKTEDYIRRLHELFVTEVGLIVPADGADEAYQFITPQIRFTLAARGVQRELERAGGGEKLERYWERIFPAIREIGDYTGLMVPLLCSTGMKQHTKLALRLVEELILRDSDGEKDQTALQRALVDLLLGRYGDSILTVASSGDPCVQQAQRLALMRLLTAPAGLTEQERAALGALPVVALHRPWLSDRAFSLLKP